ncbi:hypothetical protein LZD49_08500 [Dyadobacter sp. CY261]|uniref:hypothetical protein n=1 Tax=Dyadobacter sp. CY261 TaxID=2907203 RepID=UPI001F2A1AAF|nr:hypothetical protein [Dyadobacter sp. CY261]MCF0070510.1 hypothetical protein [Dyadobacter sp. CY261]
MKPSIKTIAMTIVFAVTFAFNTFADDKEGKKAVIFETGIFASKSGKLHVNVDKYTNDKALVVITNYKGDAIHRDMISRSTDKFRKAYNINELPEGSYTVEISAAGKKIEKHFEVTEIRTDRRVAVK